VLLVSHGHFDHIADAPALAQQYNVPIRAPGDLNQTLTTLGVLPANLLPRMNKGGTIEPVPGIKVTAVHAEHSSVYVWRNPASNKDETHPAASRWAGSSSWRTAFASTTPVTPRPLATCA
jgi:L-ascorbate metabolism protein UlaG (beta-lactamase superfamily)